MNAKTIIDATKINLNITDDSCDAKLLFCLKNVLSEVATDFIPVYHKTKLNAINGVIDISELEKLPIKLSTVRNDEMYFMYCVKEGKLLLTPKYSGEVTITYSYLPVIESPDDEVPYTEVALRWLSFGLAAEYCLVSGLDNEAVMWDKRYKDGAREAAFAFGEHRIKQRAWY